MRRLALLLALCALPACNCGGTKKPANKTSGIVVLSVNGREVTEDDTSLSFGEACVQSADVPPTAKSFLIKNTGQSPLALTGLVVSGINAASFTLTSSVPNSIAAGEQLKVDLLFAPKGAGTQSASVDITTDDPNRNTVHVRLTGSGATKLPTPAYSTLCTDGHGVTTGPDSCQYLTFPDTAVGAVGTQTVHVTNDGCPPLELRTIAVLTDASNRISDGGPSFRFHGTAPTPGSPIKLNAGESTDLAFDFIPGSNTLYAGDLFVQTNGVHNPRFSHGGFFPDGGALSDDFFYVGLSGQGRAGQVLLTPASCDFNQTDGGGNCGAHAVGSAGDVTGSFTLQNAGNVAVNVTSASSDDDGGAFTVASSAIPGSLAVGASTAISVTYHPVNGNVLAHLLVATDTGTLSSTLVGGSPPIISVDPTFLSFNDGGITDGGVADPGTLASARDFTVTNSGRGVLAVSAVSLVGGTVDGGCDGFSVPPDAGSFSVPSGGSRSVTVRFVRDRKSGGIERCEAHVASNDTTPNPNAIVSLYASTYVNCDPFADFMPSGAATFPAATDGGVFVIDGSTSFDTADSTTPRCTNGQDDGLSTWEWKLTKTPALNPASTTHLEPTGGIASCPSGAAECAVCLGNSAAGRCIDLKITTTNLFAPGPAALVNFVEDPIDGAGASGHKWDLSLTVTDGSGRISSASPSLAIVAQ
jgi:hypothetical protein